MRSTIHSTSARRRSVGFVALLVVAVAVLSGCLTAEQNASTVSINAARQARGKSTLVTLDGTTAAAYAQTWSNHLASTAPTTCKTSFPAKIADGAPVGWKGVGMAAGCQMDMGSPQATADAMMARFMAPPAANAQVILGNFTHVGVGATKTSAGFWYIVYYFIRL